MVEPPTASSTRSALVKAAGVRMRSGVSPSAASATARAPLSRATRWRSASTAGIAALPGSIMPSASAAHAMVLAVPITMQVPADGMSRPPTSAISSSSTRPPRCAPQ